MKLLLRAHVWLIATLLPAIVDAVPLGRLLALLRGRWRLYAGLSPDAIAAVVRRRLLSPRMMRRRACLREGLVLFYFLRLAGRRPVLSFCLYPTPAAGRTRGHCWVTLDGRCLTSPPSAGAVTMLEYDGSQSVASVESPHVWAR
jgi:hypothetical protein